jgi:oligoendopeptidase F
MAQKERSEVADQYKWNVYDLYPTDEAWSEAMSKVGEKIEKLKQWQGKLGESAASLADFFEYSDNLDKEITRLSVFASLKSDEDLGNQDNMAHTKEVEQLYVNYSQITAYVEPEIIAIPDEKLTQFQANEPRLNNFRMALDRLRRSKQHILSEKEELLMAKTSILGDTPSDAYSIFSDAEMPWPTITLENGESVELNQSEYSVVRASSVRADREKAFFAFWKNYKRFEGTFGELMNGNIRQSVFSAKARNYESVLDMRLHHNNIPTSVYHSLIENVNKNLPTFHRYLKLKQRLMGIDTLKYYDLYAPAVKSVELKYDYEQAKELVREAIKPLGRDYAQVANRALSERWIDVYPTKGKASGAYSQGSVYDVHPYILLNFNGRYDDVSTLIHELGHTMHSYYSVHNQPHALCHYSIFVAEVASTFNEALLDDLMLTKLTDRDSKISLLMNMLDGFKGTLFRQTQFAEFELEMHKLAEAGQPLTGKILSGIYGDILRKYYGHDKGVCIVDSCADIEWAFVPHFYMSYYVYQYSTSFVASQALENIVINGTPADRDRYLQFLSAGDSLYPIDILKNAGIDMTTSVPFDNAIKRMNKIMDEIEALL